MNEFDIPNGAKLPVVGLTEIAQRAGVQKPVVAKWRTRHDAFPEPVADLRAGPVFWWPHVKAWLIASGRRWDCELAVEEVNKTRSRASQTITRKGGPIVLGDSG